MATQVQTIDNYDEWLEVYNSTPYLDVKVGLLYAGTRFFSWDSPSRGQPERIMGAQALSFYLELAEAPREYEPPPSYYQGPKAIHLVAYFLLSQHAFKDGKNDYGEKESPLALRLIPYHDALEKLIHFFLRGRGTFDTWKGKSESEVLIVRNFALLISKYLLGSSLPSSGYKKVPDHDSHRELYRRFAPDAVKILDLFGETRFLLGNKGEKLECDEVILETLEQIALNKEIHVWDEDQHRLGFRKPKSISEAALESGAARTLILLKILRQEKDRLGRLETIWYEQRRLALEAQHLASD